MTIKRLYGKQREEFGFTSMRPIRAGDPSAMPGVAALGRLRKYARGRRRQVRTHSHGYVRPALELKDRRNSAVRVARMIKRRALRKQAAV